MNSRTQTDIWIYSVVIALGFTVITSVAAVIAMEIVSWPLLEIFVALGAVAAGGLVQILASPLNREV